MRPSSIPFYLHGRQGKPGVLFVFALPFYRSAYPRLPKEPRFSLTALVVFYFMSLCLLARGPRSEAYAPSRFPLLPALSLCSFQSANQ